MQAHKMKRDNSHLPSSSLSEEEQNLRKKSSRRFLWPDALHRDFISAVFEIGLKQASPATLAEMLPMNMDVSSEQIRSHVQKFRACFNRSNSYMR